MEEKSSSFLSSLRFAWAGLTRALSRERNMKIHAVASIMVAVVGMALELDPASRAALLFCIALVWFAEILNTALEAFVDLHIHQFHRLAMIAKDAAAAAVLVAAVATVFIFGDTIYSRWDEVLRAKEAVLRGVIFGVPLSAVVAAILFVPARRLWLLLLAAVALALLGQLIRYATGPIFAILALTVVAVSTAARLRREPDEPEAPGSGGASGAP
jgi:diacylglycerol kinase (ATP)